MPLNSHLDVAIFSENWERNSAGTLLKKNREIQTPLRNKPFRLLSRAIILTYNYRQITNYCKDSCNHVLVFPNSLPHLRNSTTLTIQYVSTITLSETPPVWTDFTFRQPRHALLMIRFNESIILSNLNFWLMQLFYSTDNKILLLSSQKYGLKGYFTPSVHYLHFNLLTYILLKLFNMLFIWNVKRNEELYRIILWYQWWTSVMNVFSTYFLPIPKGLWTLKKNATKNYINIIRFSGISYENQRWKPLAQNTRLIWGLMG